MLYEVCSYQLGRLVYSETFSNFTEAHKAYMDWCFSLSCDQVTIWESSAGTAECEETPEPVIARQASIVDKEDGTRVITFPDYPLS